MHGDVAIVAAASIRPGFALLRFRPETPHAVRRALSLALEGTFSAVTHTEHERSAKLHLPSGGDFRTDAGRKRGLRCSLSNSR